MNLSEIELPGDLGTCKRHINEGSPLQIFLIATGPGHPSADERAVLKVLEHLHGRIPIEWIFENLDGAQKSGHLYADQREYDLKPYRAYPSPEITKGIAEYFVGDGMASAATGFAILCQPAARLQPYDDWQAWIRYRDALRRLSADAGRMEGVCSLITAMLPAESAERMELQRLAGLLRLGWGYRDWITDGQRLQGLNMESLLAPIARGGSLAPLAESLASWRTQACAFYEANLSRLDALVGKALRTLRDTGAVTGAVVVNVHWSERAAELLKSGNSSFLEIVPHNVVPAPMLDHAGTFLDELSDERSRLGDLFSGERIRTRLQTMLDQPETRRKSWAGEWAMAAQGLYLGYQYDKAEACARQALEIDAGSAYAWAAMASIQFERRKYKEAESNFRKAIALEPRTATYWDGLGAVLDGAGRKREARKAMIRGLHLNPKDGALWCRLGHHLHGIGKRNSACYCFEKGEEYGSSAAAQNRGMVCRSPVSIRDCPFEVRPFWLAASKRLPWLVHLLTFLRQLQPRSG